MSFDYTFLFSKMYLILLIFSEIDLHLPFSNVVPDL